jgi:hypothetical protein
MHPCCTGKFENLLVYNKLLKVSRISSQACHFFSSEK